MPAASQRAITRASASGRVWAGIGTAPRGVRLDTLDEIRRHARLIGVHTVMTRSMPPNNITDMTLDERRVIAALLERR